jgi:uncharacterized membrane protein
MRRSPYNRHPLAPVFAIALAVLTAMVVALFVLDVVAYAYRRIGISVGALLSLVWLSLIGGLVNIPIARLRGQSGYGVDEVVVFGVRYRVPRLRRTAPTILAVNVGGAVIPAGLSVYLWIRDDVWWQAGAGVLFVTVLVYAVARPVPGLEIAVPALVPPVLAAMAAVLLAPTATAAVAYISGSLGTLIGGDLLHSAGFATWERGSRRSVAPAPLTGSSSAGSWPWCWSASPDRQAQPSRERLCRRHGRGPRGAVDLAQITSVMSAIS